MNLKFLNRIRHKVFIMAKATIQQIQLPIISLIQLCTQMDLEICQETKLSWRKKAMQGLLRWVLSPIDLIWRRGQMDSIQME